MQELLSIKTALWGPLLLTLLIGVGVYLTVILRGVQFFYLYQAVTLILKREKAEGVGDITPFQSLMTSMASAVGTGSIVGVSTALTVGGLGAVFWLWVTAFISMAIKYAESLLAVKYRVVDDQGRTSGGPMQYIERGLGWKWLAVLFAMFSCIAVIGTGNLVQVNAIVEAVREVYDIDPAVLGAVLMIVTGFILFGGIKSIARVSSWLVPIMALLYIFSGLIVIFCCIEQLPGAIGLIFSSAFTGQAATGGILGSTAMMAVQMGVSRCVFSSEAGLGISSIAAAAAKTNSSGRQAMLSMTGTLVSTAVICTITALVIAVTGCLGQMDQSGAPLNGVGLAIAAFSSVLSIGKYVVVLGLILFAYTTILAWAYYGEKCFEYLFGLKAVLYYRALYVLLIFPGALFALEAVWCFADIMNALMVIPNMIALLGLSGVVQRETQLFIQSTESQSI